MLVQLLLCIGLPVLVLPILVAAAYFAFRHLKARRKKAAQKDLERDGFVESSISVDSEVELLLSRHVMTPALVSNSVQVPAGFSRNF